MFYRSYHLSYYIMRISTYSCYNTTTIYVLHYGKNLPINPLTILSDKSSGRNLRNPKKYSATLPYTNIFKHMSNVF